MLFAVPLTSLLLLGAIDWPAWVAHAVDYLVILLDCILYLSMKSRLFWVKSADHAFEIFPHFAMLHY